MKSPILNLKTCDDRQDVLHVAVEALMLGKVIAVPTETVYGLCALATNAEAVERLFAIKNRPEGCPVSICVKNEADALDYAPGMSTMARRLARRCWAGPVTLVVEHGPLEKSLIGKLPEKIQQAVAPSGSVGLRVVANESTNELLQYLPGPLVLTSANRSGEEDATTAEQVAATFGDEVDLILDDGPSRYGQPSTVVRVDGPKYEILRAGVVSEATIERLASFMALMVCTGNTCRSPLAEVVFKKHLAERLDCKIEDIEENGAIVMSAGLAASRGNRPSSESVEIAKEMGLSLNGHLSQPLTESLIEYSDIILTMTRNHHQAILAQCPDAASRTEVLRLDQRDITDPIGGSIEVYRACAEQIDKEIEARVKQLEL